MNEEKFWNLINLINWNQSNDKDKLMPLVETLAKESEEDIYKFQDILTEKLYLLDGEKYAKNIGEDSYREDTYFSVDVFLYIRACVVANGKDYYESVLENPELMPKDKDFEPLIYVAHEAYTIKTGNEDWNYEPKLLYETYFNRKGWNKGENISILEFIGANKVK